jgi:hypothetical protein
MRTSSGLNFEEEDNCILVSGKTFPLKDTLKGLGGLWNPEKKAWALKKEVATEDVIMNLICDLAEATPKKPLVQTTRPSWVCCSAAKIVDARKMVTVCHVHARDAGGGEVYTRRIGGSIYTGD